MSVGKVAHLEIAWSSLAASFKTAGFSPLIAEKWQGHLRGSAAASAALQYSKEILPVVIVKTLSFGK